MKKCIGVTLLFVSSAVALSSCGVMFGGSYYNASVAVKEHPEALIYVNGRYIGKGAAIGRFPRKNELMVEVRQQECEGQFTTFGKRFRTGNFLLSALMWGTSGIVIDLVTGACYKPDHVRNPAIEKQSTRDFFFTVDYAGCPTGKEKINDDEGVLIPD
jgi:hypothetical protein